MHCSASRSAESLASIPLTEGAPTAQLLAQRCSASYVFSSSGSVASSSSDRGPDGIASSPMGAVAFASSSDCGPTIGRMSRRAVVPMGAVAFGSWSIGQHDLQLTGCSFESRRVPKEGHGACFGQLHGVVSLVRFTSEMDRAALVASVRAAGRRRRRRLGRRHRRRRRRGRRRQPRHRRRRPRRRRPRRLRRGPAAEGVEGSRAGREQPSPFTPNSVGVAGRAEAAPTRQRARRRARQACFPAREARRPPASCLRVRESESSAAGKTVAAKCLVGPPVEGPRRTSALGAARPKRQQQQALRQTLQQHQPPPASGAIPSPTTPSAATPSPGSTGPSTPTCCQSLRSRTRAPSASSAGCRPPTQRSAPSSSASPPSSSACARASSSSSSRRSCASAARPPPPPRPRAVGRRRRRRRGRGRCAAPSSPIAELPAAAIQDDFLRHRAAAAVVEALEPAAGDAGAPPQPRGRAGRRRRRAVALLGRRRRSRPRRPRRPPPSPARSPRYASRAAGRRHV